MQVYLDNSATTRPTVEVVQAMCESMNNNFYNPSAMYASAMEAEGELRACSQAVAERLWGKAEQVLFTSGGTEANNLAILGSVDALYGKASLVTTKAEHPSVLKACEHLQKQGHRVIYVDVDGEGQIVWQQLERALAGKPGLVSCMQVNNETGVVTDIEKVAKLTRLISPETLIHIDGVQGFLRVPFDVRQVDMYTLSAHKVGGPKGVGALYYREGLRLEPQLLGGGQQRGLRSGTENMPGIVGLKTAVQAWGEIEQQAEKLAFLKYKFWEQTKDAVADAIINGSAPEEAAPHIINISFPGVRGEVMLHALEAYGIYCSTGAACSSKKRKLSPVLEAMGLNSDRAQSALRFSFSPENTVEEIEFAAQKIGETYDQLKLIRRK